MKLKLKWINVEELRFNMDDKSRGNLENGGSQHTLHVRKEH